MTAAEVSELRQRAREAFAVRRDETWETLAGLDFFANLAPQPLGGTGAGLLPSAILLDELASTGYAPMLAGFAALATSAIARFGSEQLMREALPPLLSGRRRVAIAATEEKAGFNLFEIETFADGLESGYRLTGSKAYISGADECDYLLLVARSLRIEEAARRDLPRTAGLSVFLVPRDTPGITVEPMTTRGEGKERQYRVRLEDVEIDGARRLGPEHEGVRVLFPSFNMERTLFAALTCGLAGFCLATATDHARRRRV